MGKRQGHTLDLEWNLEGDTRSFSLERDCEGLMSPMAR